MESVWWWGDLAAAGPRPGPTHHRYYQAAPTHAPRPCTHAYALRRDQASAEGGNPSSSSHHSAAADDVDLGAGIAWPSPPTGVAAWLRRCTHGLQAGNIVGADCLILEEIEDSLLPPGDPNAIESVRIELTDLGGETTYGFNDWSRTGSTTCTIADGVEMDVPYTLTAEGYPDSQRCNVLAGCPTMSPARGTVDSIGVHSLPPPGSPARCGHPHARRRRDGRHRAAQHLPHGAQQMMGRIAAADQRTRERGQGLVEFVLVLPIMLLLLAGVVEIGLVANDTVTIGYGSREGARAGSSLGNGGVTDCNGGSDPHGVDQSIVASVQRIIESSSSDVALATSTRSYLSCGDRRRQSHGEVTRRYAGPNGPDIDPTEGVSRPTSAPRRPWLPASNQRRFHARHPRCRGRSRRGRRRCLIARDRGHRAGHDSPRGHRHDAEPDLQRYMIQRLRGRADGTAGSGPGLVIFVFATFVMIGASAITADASWLIVNQQRMQRAADAAALAGAVFLPGDPDQAYDTAYAEAARNGYTNGSDGIAITPTTDPTNPRRLIVDIAQPVDVLRPRLLHRRGRAAHGRRRCQGRASTSARAGCPQNYFGVSLLVDAATTTTVEDDDKPTSGATLSAPQRVTTRPSPATAIGRTGAGSSWAGG
jgi:Flp pilus assembly protein TadG